MMKNFRLNTIVIAFAALCAVASASAIDSYLWFGDHASAGGGRLGNRSQTTEPAMVDVDIDAWMAAAQRGSGGGAGKAAFNDLSFMMRQYNPMVILKRYDKASPQLYQACCTGKHIPSAKLFVRKAGGDPKEYYVIEMENIMVSGYSVSSGGDRPMESLSLNFTKVEMRSASDEEKAMVRGWDIKKNEGG